MDTIGFNVEELNSSELQQIDGGFPPLIIYGGAILIGIAVGATIKYLATHK